MLPLAEIRVVDLTNLLPGPYCTMVLADLGAEVIKIERPPAGDPIRSAFPGIFETVNRNKKSLSLDLRQVEGKAVLTKLIERSDVLLEGFRPGVLEKLGFGYEQVRSINERIIYCSISGFGQSGPYRDVPGHDVNYLAVSGVLSISGNPDGPPAAWGGVQVADLSTSMYAAVSVLAALRAREQTGQGDYLDIAITDCVLSWLGPRMGEYYGRGKPPKSEFMGRGAYGAFAARDNKHIVVGALENHFWQNLCRALDLGEMAQRKEYGTWPQRMERAGEINAVLREHFLTKDSAEWLAILQKADVPCCLVNSIDDLSGDAHLAARGMIHLQEGRPQVSFPVKFNHTQIAEAGLAPQVGEHNKEILAGLGYGPEEIEKLQAVGAI